MREDFGGRVKIALASIIAIALVGCSKGPVLTTISPRPTVQTMPPTSPTPTKAPSGTVTATFRGPRCDSLFYAFKVENGTGGPVDVSILVNGVAGGGVAAPGETTFRVPVKVTDGYSVNVTYGNGVVLFNGDDVGLTC
jgi:hypothetical protein